MVKLYNNVAIITDGAHGLLINRLIKGLVKGMAEDLVEKIIVDIGTDDKMIGYNQ